FGQNGYIRTAYSYTPYGSVTANGDITQPIQWSSEYTDTDLALVYYNYRHYNPMDGRWLGRDPIGEVDKFNLFIYIQSQPISYIDLLGRNNMNFWSPTACMPISKPTRSLLPSGIGKTDFIPKKGNDVLVFDGEKNRKMRFMPMLL
ncbi:MAG: RHS repeat-associated core domain-containing protein, partial [Akkermansia sp.]|nr:RHS repeat-associated core domain-containing protein [Akkermansia sp.]